MAEFNRPSEPQYDTRLYGQAFAAAISGSTEVRLSRDEDTPENRVVIAKAFSDASERLATEIKPTLSIDESTPTIERPAKSWRTPIAIGVAISALCAVGYGISSHVQEQERLTIHYDNSQKGIAAAKAACNAPDSRQNVKIESVRFAGDELTIRSSTDSLVLKGDITNVQIPDEVRIGRLVVCTPKDAIDPAVHVNGEVDDILMGNRGARVEVDRGAVKTVRVAIDDKRYNECSIITTPDKVIIPAVPLGVSGLDNCAVENNTYWSS